VAREVKEEVGIDVENIKYFGSQPWPFPDSLMLAFTAEYAGGEIKQDQVEIVEAGWFRVNEIPKVPTGGSVARKLIEWFIDNNK
jgi:NAD+ diphosphatase